MPPITPVVKNMIIINVMVFLFIQITSIQMPAISDYMPLYNFGSDYFQPFQFVSNMFSHFSLGHLFFNMLTLFFFGPMVEMRIGFKRTFIGYMAGGVIASIIFLLYFSFIDVQPFQLLGASGAVYTIITLAALYYPNQKAGFLFIPVSFPLKYLAMFFIAIDLFAFSTGIQTGLAHLAHLGGVAVGFILHYLWEKR